MHHALAGALLVFVACGGGAADRDGGAGRDGGNTHDGGVVDADVGGPADAGIVEPPLVCVDQCVYVRAGASGTGADWADALPGLPTTPERGKVYLIAAGTYPAPILDTPASGGERIVIKRATDDVHGTETGWQAAYGQGQAIWEGTVVFETSHWVFDGSRRDEGDWFDGDAYGFRIYHNDENIQVVVAAYLRQLDDITVKHVFVDAIIGLPVNQVRRYAVDTDAYGEDFTSTNLVFTRMYVRGSSNVWFLRDTDGAIVEYSASSDADSNGKNHGEIVNLYYSGENAIIRYNHFRDAFIGTTGTALVAITAADGLQFYGNLSENFSTGDAAIGYGAQQSSANRIYNNTFVRSVGFNGGTAFGAGTDNLVYNNVWVDCATVRVEGTHDFNVYGDDNDRGEANAVTGAGASIFVDAANGNYRLAAPTAAGMTVPAPFDRDLDGRVRGADGTFDRGAFEFGP